MLRRFIAGLFLALAPFFVSAQTEPIYEYSYTNGTYFSGWHRSPGSVLDDRLEYLRQNSAICTSGARSGLPVGTYQANGTALTTTGAEGYYILTSYSCTTGTANTPSNRTISMSRRAAVNTCTAGQTTQKTYFAGWAATSAGGESIPGTDPDTPLTYCDGSCFHDLEEVVSCDVDQEPGPNGYYEQTCTYEYKATGGMCTEQTPDPDKTPEPAPPNPPDDGDPGDGDPGGPGDGDGDGPGDGEPGDGEPGDGEPGDGEPGDGGGGGDCVPTENNPCDDGGPGGGSGGDGPGEGEDDGEEKGAECGVPGKPACSVKVDETGTASVDQLLEQVSEMHDYTQTLSGPNGEINQMNDDLKNMNPGSVFGMNDWSWSFQLPTGCTPLVMADFNVTIDPCQWQSTIHDLMSMIWIISTFFGVLWIARGTF